MNKDQEGFITTINAYSEGDLRKQQLSDAVCEEFGPEDLFRPTSLEIPILFRYFKEWLEEHDVRIKDHASNSIIMRLFFKLYKDPDLSIALNCIKKYSMSGYASKQNIAPGSNPSPNHESISTNAKDETIAKTAHSIAMRFKDKGAKFSGNIYENWKRFLNEYVNACSDYNIPMDKRVQFMYHILKEYAGGFYDEQIRGRVTVFGEACQLMDKEYNS